MPPAIPPIVARAGLHDARTAIIEGEQRYSYRDLRRAAAQVAARLLGSKGIRDPFPAGDLREERVAFLIPPGFDHVAVQWGIWSAGGVAVPLPMGHPPAELDYLIRDSEAAIVVAASEHVEQLAPIATAAGARLVTTEEVIESAIVDRPSSIVRMVQTIADRQSPIDDSATRRALMVYTSGTTGRPKGVVTTHANIAAQIASLTAAWEWTPADRTLLVLPLHHVHGIINVVSCALWSGAVLEILPRFDPETTWSRLAAGDLTLFTAVPTIYHRLIQSWEAATPELRRERSLGSRKLRVMMSGSAPLPRHVLDRWKEITGHVLLERYGMTEVGMALSNPLHSERRPGTVGQPLPGVSVRLVDEQGDLVTDGTPGEIQLQGPGIFSEYWKCPESTRGSFVGGWFRTGDIAVLEDGAFRLLGRSSVDIIKSGGNKISALEIEEVLRSHPAVSECAVVGVEDPEWGQRVCAAVELQPGSRLTLNDLREWARTRMAPYKIPKELRCVSRLPRNAMGKIVKPEVATLFARPAPPAPREI